MKRYVRIASVENPRNVEYYDYLDQHISGVVDSWALLLYPQLVDSGLDKQYNIDTDKTRHIIYDHDDSKYDINEFIPYCNYFYPNEETGHTKDENAFNQAWLLHIHNNPHHWQHWILVHDEGDMEPLDMPPEYICEMICDWHSFSRRDPSSTAYDWYTKNKDNMVLSDNTRAIVESLIGFMKDPLPPR